MWNINEIEDLLSRLNSANRPSKDSPSHKHACMNCGEVWEHPDYTVYLPHDEFLEAHSCPKCGDYQTFKDTPLNRWCGIDPKLPRETRMLAVKLAEEGVPPELARRRLGLQ